MNKEESLNLLFHSLADGTRRDILKLVAKEELTFGEITKRFASSKQAISKHIMILEKAGLVKKEKSGRICKCKFEPEPLHEVIDTIEEYKEFWNGQLNNLENYLRTMK